MEIDLKVCVNAFINNYLGAWCIEFIQMKK